MPAGVVRLVADLSPAYFSFFIIIIATTGRMGCGNDLKIEF